MDSTPSIPTENLVNLEEIPVGWLPGLGALSSANYLPPALYDIYVRLGGNKIHLAIDIFLVSRKVEPVCYLREDPEVDLTCLLDDLGLCLTNIRGGHLLIHHKDNITALREVLRKEHRRNHIETLHVILSTSLMQRRNSNNKEPSFLIQFLVTFDEKEIGVAETEIYVENYTPEMRLQIIELLHLYKSTLGSALQVRAHYYEHNVRTCSDEWDDEGTRGLPPGQLL